MRSRCGRERQAISDHEQQQQRDQQREDAEGFCQREAEQQRAALAVSSRRVAQRTREELAEQVAEADAGAAMPRQAMPAPMYFAAMGSMGNS